jgi:Ni/Co efflux regulator RcnB
MNRFAVVGTICASFLLAGTISARAQDDRREERKEDRKEEKHEARKDERRERQNDRHEEHRRIKEEHFRRRFGREHHFAVRHVTVVEGRPRFAYGGYRFAIVQPWPVGWAYADDVYIDLIDGEYYLFNLRHPGVRVAVEVLP